MYHREEPIRVKDVKQLNIQAVLGKIATPLATKPNTDEQALAKGYTHTQSFKKHIDIGQSLKNYQAIIDTFNQNKPLGEQLKQQHKSLLHKLVVLLSNQRSITTQQVGKNWYYVLNIDAKGIATEANYTGKEPEKSIKAHIERVSNLDVSHFTILQIGVRSNQYRYLIGLAQSLISWKEPTPPK